MKNLTIEVRNLDVIYKKILPVSEQNVAIKDMSFELEPGKVYGLIGRNGAGKTSLLSILANFRSSSRGEVLINGENLFDNSKYSQDIQFIYQKEFSTDSGDTYPKLIKYIKRETEFRPNFDLEYALELVKKFNLPTNKRPHRLSKGQQSALSVVIGLASRTPVTIFDEAYLGMDAPTRDLFYKEVLVDQERYPRTIIMSTHLVSEMEYLFDEVIMIDKGELLMKGAYDEIIASALAITGPSEEVDRFVAGRPSFNTEFLGGYKKVMLQATLSEKEISQLKNSSLEVSQLSLQDLFIGLTGGVACGE